MPARALRLPLRSSIVGEARRFALLGTRRWTFRRGSGGPFRHLAVQLAGLGLTDARLWLLVSTARFEKIAGHLLAVAAVATVTFVANRSWSFAT
jgi:GtrA-like protein